MTLVEESVSGSAPKKSTDQENFAKIVEVTGINDLKLIEGAIHAVCNKNGSYDVADVIQHLVTQPSTTLSTIPASVSEFNKDADTEKNVIDLTNEASVSEKEQLQNAIEESLRDSLAQPGNILGGQISREEQDISRVLEQSLQETKAGTKRKRGDIWFVDPLNPHERKRNGNWPVGLKNVGNTCWFSCVIQSLFNLPVFRRLVLTFEPPCANSSQTTQDKKRNLDFMNELRFIFALMLYSKRKYIDPSKAVDILKEAFTSSSSEALDAGQQDVSEFQHKLLEWLEDAFRVAPQSPQPDNTSTSPQFSDNMEDGEKMKNPMVNLFYGQSMTEGKNNGVSFKNTETFGQFPLQVAGFSDIHESLEADTAQVAIESVSGESTSTSGQELWFTRLPSVLTFELSRFHFNTNMGRPEKIHNQLQFPETLYLDRYLECNKCLTRQKRSEMKKIKNKLQELHQKLDKYMNYGSGPSRYPLQDVLQYTLEFAQSQAVMATVAGSAGPGTTAGNAGVTQGTTPPQHLPNTESPHPNDVHMESPKASLSMQTSATDANTAATTVQSTTPSSPSSAIPNPATPTTPTTPTSSHHLPTSTAAMRSPLPRPDAHVPTPSKMSKLEAPSPRHVTGSELHTLQSCLGRWRAEVEADVKELQDSINKLEMEMNNMYADPELKKHAYRLHSVFVHEGQAASGHYWAYVYSTVNQRWLKYNDISVVASSWEELCADSYGGANHNASAYCLMYVDASRKDLFQESSKTSDTLCLELEKYVNMDNATFAQELELWDRRATQAAQATQDTGSATSPRAEATWFKSDSAGASASLASATTQGTQTSVAQKNGAMPMRHANLLATHTSRIIEEGCKDASFTNTQPDGVALAFKKIVEGEWSRVMREGTSCTSKFPFEDPRLNSIIIYVYHANGRNDVEPEVVKRLLFEQFSLPPLLQSSPRATLIVKKAQTELDNSRRKAEKNLEFDNKHKYLHEEYSNFRRLANNFTCGLEAYHKERYTEALPLFCTACEQNRKISLSRRYTSFGLADALLLHFRRQCLLQINASACDKFEAGEELGDVFTTMNELVIPCLGLLASSSTPLDIECVEQVRDRWCSFLNLQIDDVNKEKFQDMFSKMFEPTHEESWRLTIQPRTTAGGGGARIADLELSSRYHVAMRQAREELEQVFGAGCATLRSSSS